MLLSRWTPVSDGGERFQPLAVNVESFHRKQQACASSVDDTSSDAHTCGLQFNDSGRINS